MNFSIRIANELFDQDLVIVGEPFPHGGRHGVDFSNDVLPFTAPIIGLERRQAREQGFFSKQVSLRSLFTFIISLAYSCLPSRSKMQTLARQGISCIDHYCVREISGNYRVAVGSPIHGRPHVQQIT